MARQRLTSSAKIGETNVPAFPGNLGNEDRPTTPREKYDNFVEQPGFEVQQQGAPWKEDKHDEIGFGIPKAAAVFATAHKATRLAIMFLGDKVAPTVIEAQARDFMRLGSNRIDSALKRFADSEGVYAAEEKEEAKEECAEEKTAEAKDDAKAEDKKEDKAEECAEEKTAEAKSEDADTTKEQKESSVAVVADEDVALQDFTDDESMTIDMFSEPEIAPDMTDDDAADVGSLFDIDEIGDGTMASAKPQPKKAGVKTLGGQPSLPQARVASENDELAGLWKDAPDVSDVFGNE